MKIRIAQKIADKVFFDENNNLNVATKFYRKFCNECGADMFGVFLTVLSVSKYKEIDSLKDFKKYLRKSEKEIQKHIELLIAKKYIEIDCEE